MKLQLPTEDTLAIIMGGGAGTRLFPLTKKGKTLERFGPFLKRTWPLTDPVPAYNLFDLHSRGIVVVPKGAVIPAGTPI